VPRSSTTSIKRPTPQPAAKEGRSRLGDLTREIPVERKLSRRPKIALGVGLFSLAVLGLIAAAVFVLPVGTWIDQGEDLERRQAELDELTRVNSELEAEVNRLGTDDGAREAAREEIGLVDAGERRTTVELPDALPTDLPDGWPYNVVTAIIAARTAGPAPPTTE
jgi:cell division protein FtsB